MKNTSRVRSFLIILGAIILQQSSTVYATLEEHDNSKKRENSSIILSHHTEEDSFPPPLEKVSLDSITSTFLSPGIYESDSMEKILCFPLSNFGEQDLVVFDMDQTLIAQLNPYYHVHEEKETALHKRLIAQPKHIKEKFDAFMFIYFPLTPMDRKTPTLIKKLQDQKVNCIANTAMHPILSSVENVNVPLLRVRSLHTVGIDFATTYSHLPFWGFDTLDTDYLTKYRPVFREGIILSSDVPKHVTTLELLRKLSFRPKKVAFIDDSYEHAQKMYEGLRAEGIEVYSFVYTKAHKTSSLDYFTAELATTHLARIESFLVKLLDGENVDDAFNLPQ